MIHPVQNDNCRLFTIAKVLLNGRGTEERDRAENRYRRTKDRCERDGDRCEVSIVLYMQHRFSVKVCLYKQGQY